MTPERLKECLDLLGWSGRHLAEMTARDPKQVRRWLAGTRIPEDVAAWVESRARDAERNPPPEAPDRPVQWWR